MPEKSEEQNELQFLFSYLSLAYFVMTAYITLLALDPEGKTVSYALFSVFLVLVAGTVGAIIYLGLMNQIYSHLLEIDVRKQKPTLKALILPATIIVAIAWILYPITAPQLPNTGGKRGGLAVLVINIALIAPFIETITVWALNKAGKNISLEREQKD